MENTKSSYGHVNDCLNIVRNEFKERIASTKMRNDFERNIIGDVLKDSQLNIEKSILSILEESLEDSTTKTSYHLIKSCLKTINSEFKNRRKGMLLMNSEEQSIFGNLITSTEIELEKFIKQKLDEVPHPPLTEEELAEQEEIEKYIKLKKENNGQNS